MQDFTGVPVVVDLAAMRSALARLGGDPKEINPTVPVDLVIDHSVQVDYYASPDALRRNAELEFPATASATSFCTGPKKPSRISALFPRRPALFTRSTWNTWPAWSLTKDEDGE